MPEESKKTKEEDVPTEDEKVPIEDEEIEIVDEEDEEQGYRVKLKPDLSKEEIKAMNLRSHINDNRPKFRRQEWFRYKKLGTKWRKSVGISSKMRRNYKYRVNMPNPGYRSPKAVRGRHPSGFEDILVYNTKELEGLDPKKQAIRIAHTVGTRKRGDIEKKAKDMNLRILNRGL